MAALSLLFTFDVTKLRADFENLEFSDLGISFGDGSSPKDSSGTLIYQGAAFEYAILNTTNPSASHHIFCNADMSETGSSLSLDIGAAIASGQHVPAVIKALLLLGEKLGSALAAKASFWEPASIITGFDYYAGAVTQYAASGVFPSLVCVAFDRSSEESIRTSGLAWLCGQELMLERDGLPEDEATRYMVSLVHDLATGDHVDGLAEADAHENILVVRPQSSHAM
jgi:hypothetical protein